MVAPLSSELVKVAHPLAVGLGWNNFVPGFLLHALTWAGTGSRGSCARRSDAAAIIVLQATDVLLTVTTVDTRRRGQATGRRSGGAVATFWSLI